MRKLLILVALAVVVLAIVALATPTPVQAAGGGCPKTTPVACYDCNGHFAYCARSHAFCPECAQP